MVDNKIYTIITDFNYDCDSEDYEKSRDELFEKELELLCLRYGAKLDYKIKYENIY